MSQGQAHTSSGPFANLFAALSRGELTRRQFIERATALGMGATVAAFCANTVAASASASVAAQEDEPALTERPAVDTEDQSRGEGGELRILQWQPPSHLSPQTSTGDKDSLAACIVCEPLMHYLPDGTMIPNLVEEVPSVENGLLAEDLTSVTYNLLPDVLWNDGEPFTAEDVRFTWEWVMDEANNSTNIGIFRPISDIEVVDDTTLTVTFTEPTPTWADPHTGSGSGSIYPAHILRDGGQDAHDAFRMDPVGTGPYMVESFTPNDEVIYAVNEHYRDPNKPYFERVILQGGGDAVSAARAVLQTGEYDFAWNTTAEPDVLENMVSDDGPGHLVVDSSTSVERININFSDPNTEVDGQRSEMNTPHPFFSEHAVRQAMFLSIDRQLIADSFFFGGDLEPPASNILSGIPAMESPNTELEFDPERAREVLEEAGWTAEDGGVRSKDGVELRVRFSTTVDQLRQRIQAVVKDNMEDVGFAVDLLEIDSGVFFDSSPGNEQNNTHFYTDLNMFRSSAGAPPPVAFMVRWYTGEDGEEIAQESNGWGGRNIQRYQNPEYDEVYEQAQVEADPERLAELFVQLNDILIEDYAVFPVVRAGSKTAISRRLNEENLAISAFEFDYWNIANWRWDEGAEAEG